MMADNLPDGIGHRVVESLVSDPVAGELQLAEYKGDLSSCVTTLSSFWHIEWARHDIIRKRAAEMISKQSKRELGAKNTALAANMNQCLSQVWGGMQRMVQHDPVKVVDSSDAGPVPLQARLCHTCNECWCGRSGEKKLQFLKSMVSFVTKACPAKSASRDHLLDGRLVLIMIGGLRAGPAMIGDQDQVVIKVLLLADVDLKPFTFYFHELALLGEEVQFRQQLQRDEENGRGLYFDGVVRLASAGHNHTHWKVVRMFDLSVKWEAMLCKVVCDESLEVDFGPSFVDVQAFADASSVIVWDPERARAQRARRDAFGDWAEVLRRRDGRGELPQDAPADDVEAAMEEEEEEPCEEANEEDAEDEGSDFEEVGADEAGNEEEHNDEVVVEGDGVAGAGADHMAVVAQPQAPVADPEHGGPKRIAVVVPGFGELVWYRSSPARAEFYAYCHSEAHIKRPGDADFDDPDNVKPRMCRKCRSAKAGSKAFMGRPLGFLMCWLMDQQSHDSSFDHIHLHPQYSFEDRLAARAALLEVDGSGDLFARERPCVGDEGDEPSNFQ